MGRPPKPVEVKRRTGRAPGRDTGGRKLPEVVSFLRMSEDVPAPPVELGLAGQDLWKKAWAAAITWLSEDSDWTAVTMACQLADDLVIARRRYQATSDPADARAMVSINHELTSSLSVLGFDPTSRSKLGVAEVKKLGALEQLLANRADSASRR